MLLNYLTIALRNLAKYRLYTAINIIGLTIGLSVFLFGVLLANYETNHDHMFDKRDRIFTVGSLFSPTSGESISEFPNARLAYGPLFKDEIPQLEKVVRSLSKERLLTINNKHVYQQIRFVENGFTELFNFDYLYGDKNALAKPNGLIITANTAQHLFGTVDVLDEIIQLDHQTEMVITAVIKDVAVDSHFNSSLLPNQQLSLIAPLAKLIQLQQFQAEGEWRTLHPGDITYILLPMDKSKAWLQSQVDAIYQKYTGKKEQSYIHALKVRPLIELNIQVWDSLGFPVIESFQIFGLLILMVACLNYANLTTAQSFSRTREIGLRKTFGANKGELLSQFLIESITIASFSMVLALACLELIIPIFNLWTGKQLSLNYLAMLPWALLLTLIIGFIAGAYPAYLITRQTPIDSLHNKLQKGRGGIYFRQAMISLQFAISLFILSIVMIVHFQNEKMLALSQSFLKNDIDIVDLRKMDNIHRHHKALKVALEEITGIEAVSFSSSVPFHNAGNNFKVTMDRQSNVPPISVFNVSIDEQFLNIFNSKVIAGKPFKTKALGQTAEKLTVESTETPTPVVINQLLAKSLGFTEEQTLIGKTFYQWSENPVELAEGKAKVFQIQAVIKDEYYLGVHMQMRPFLFIQNPARYDLISIRFNEQRDWQTDKEINLAWQKIVTNYPIRQQPLRYYFNLFFRIPVAINQAISLFASIAMSLAFIGLFGMTAFLAQRRTKEIGLRKVMGANVSQIIRLMIWQLSKPIFCSLVVALPLAYWTSNIYLTFFPERIDNIFTIISLSSLSTIVISWLIISSYVMKIAKKAPIKSLRYE